MKDFPLFRELQRRHLAVKQFNANRLFQRTDAAAECRLRDVATDCRLGKIAAFFQGQKIIKPFSFNIMQNRTTVIHYVLLCQPPLRAFYVHSGG